MGRPPPSKPRDPGGENSNLSKLDAVPGSGPHPNAAPGASEGGFRIGFARPRTPYALLYPLAGGWAKDGYRHRHRYGPGWVLGPGAGPPGPWARASGPVGTRAARAAPGGVMQPRV